MDIRSFLIARSRRNWLSQAKLRSTTQRHRPSPVPCSVLRIASKGRIPRSRRTNSIPTRHSRAAKRGLPPSGFVFGAGMKGSTSLRGRDERFDQLPQFFRQEFSRHWTILLSRRMCRCSGGCRENEGFVRSIKTHSAGFTNKVGSARATSQYPTIRSWLGSPLTGSNIAAWMVTL